MGVALYLKVVESELDPGLLSIRPCNSEGDVLGKATTLKRMLKEKGFQPGDVLAVDLKKYIEP